ncbi:MAG: PVC-type heme-binding CxxCH protein, partial [Pirellulales bacterium]
MSRRLRTSTPLLLIAFSIAGAAAAEPAKTELQLELRSREKVSDKLEEYRAVIAPATWDARETAIVVCDMWDRHWCAGATERVAQMAPRMNEVLKAARARGVLIIHCPSGVVHRYNDTPQRKLAQQAPPLDLPRPIQPWSHRDGDRETALPIDDSDGGCDCQLRCRQGGPWKAQIETLEIAAGDAVTDNAEAFYLMKQRGIKNVVVMGVHTNMCVLGRPFSIRQMVHQGQNVVLMRDMTDTMYNSRMRPFVSHFTGTDLVVEHIEKYWCPTITSAAFLGGEEFRFPADRRPHLAIVMAEPEYGTDRTLPEFARTHLGRDFRVSLVFADADDGNQLPGVEVLDKADVALFSIRRRTPPAKQMAVIRRFIEAGKPLVAVRTSNHAFSLRGQPPPVGHAAWEEFDREVIGGNYHGHYPNKARGEDRTIIWPLKEAGEHPILAGIPQAEQIVPSGLYKNRPLAESSTPLLMGRFGSQQPHEPVAWTNQTKWGGKVFYAAVGSPEEIADKNIARLLVNAVHWAVGRPADADPQPQEPPGQVPEPDASQQGADPQPAAQQAAVDYRQWTLLAVPGTWEEQSGGKLEYDGMAWYRCHAKVPAAWKKEYLELSVEQVDNAHEAYFNGQRIGRGGNFPPDYVNAVDHAGRYQVPANLVAADQYNEIVIRVYDHGGRGGFKGPAPALFNERQVIDLTGKWEFRTGDDLDWLGGARERADQAAAPFEKVVRAAEIAPRAASVRRAPGSQTPEEAARGFQVPADLRWESVLAEPEIRQPVSISFDERGRLWVVQYQQYPHPAGLKMVSRDNYWRAVYDKVPPPPPNHFVGKDKITIHTDTNGDGRFDEHKTFVDGLNICTAAVPGRGGVWVLNPPYLLFYPDANRDDVPDGDPEVHLQGFGLEDTHSTVNSLRFGPDGWLYAAQGSTVSGQVKRPGTTEEPVRTMGQLIWRYHPEQRRYEVFAEGGGNSYGVEFDAQGRLYSGHNGGNTRGFHFVQGGYYRKGFGKHGALSNPYTFGFFEAMKHHEVPRFSHTFLIYESHGLPPEYRGMLYGLEPMQGQIVRSKLSHDRSSFMTEDVDRVVRTDDDWFRPVDVKEGP